MKQVTWTITENTPLTPDTYRLRLTGDTEAITAPRSVRKSEALRLLPAPPHLRLRLGARCRHPYL